MNILDKITAYKKEEVAKNKTLIPAKALEAELYFSRTCFSLEKSIKNTKKTGIIAEFKRKSPSKDIINAEASVKEVTQAYSKHGASGLSVLTDQHFFGGGNADLIEARENNETPILRKDFIIDEYQIIEAKAIGADVVLLIAECLSAKKVAEFTRFAKNLDLEVLLEMHSEQQLDKVSPENNIIGINNRDLTTFKVDIERSIELSEKLPSGTLKIAESGISKPEVVKQMRQAGFQGFLMGEHFMKTKQPGKAFRKFAEQINE